MKSAAAAGGAPPSIRRRIISAGVAISLAGGLLVALAVWWVVGEELDQLMDHSLHESAEIIHNVLVVEKAQAHPGQAAPDGGEYESDLIWQVIDGDQGRVLNRSHRAPGEPLRLSVLPSERSRLEGEWRVVTIGFRDSPARFLLVAQSQAERDEARLEVVAYTSGIALLMVLISGLWLNYALRRELEPVDRLSMAVRHYDPLQPSTFSADAARSELMPVQEAVQDLGKRLAQRLVSERAFTHHAAHALRTPLAGIEAQLAAALPEVPEQVRPRIERARQASLRLGRVMQALMMMFRSGIEPRWERVPLSELLRPALLPAVQVHIGRDLVVHADPDLMTAVLLNLLDNAQRHQASGVWIDAEIKPGGSQCLVLRDDGQGCDEERRMHLEAALARQDYSPKTGLSGLGLILADLVLRAHGGRVTLLRQERGFGIALEWPGSP